MIWEDKRGDAWFTVDQPSQQFASFGMSEITDVGIESTISSPPSWTRSPSPSPPTSENDGVLRCSRDATPPGRLSRIAREARKATASTPREARCAWRLPGDRNLQAPTSTPPPAVSLLVSDNSIDEMDEHAVTAPVGIPMVRPRTSLVLKALVRWCLSDRSMVCRRPRWLTRSRPAAAACLVWTIVGIAARASWPRATRCKQCSRDGVRPRRGVQLSGASGSAAP